MDNSILILGLGNILMGDEGIGIKAVEYLQQQTLPSNVDVLDGGAGGFQLLSLFQEYQHFIIIDATIGGDKPGEIQVLNPRFASEFPRSLTSHDIGLKDLMQSAELLATLPSIYLLTVNVEECSCAGMKISKKLLDQLPLIQHRVLDIIKQIEQK
jgi:hydrogenase maturation protease